MAQFQLQLMDGLFLVPSTIDPESSTASIALP
jgi:hypothetical protein